MRNFINIAANIFKITFMKKGNVVIYIILPIAITVALISVLGNHGTSKIIIGIVDKDKTVYSTNMLEYIKSTGKFVIKEINEYDISDKVASGNVDFALVIPKHFGESIYKCAPQTVDIISIKGQEAIIWIENYINYYIKNLNNMCIASDGNREVFNKMYNNYKKNGFKLISNPVKDVSRNKSITRLIIGMFIMFIMMSSSVTSRIIIKDKRRRTYYRICSSPVSSRTYVLSNAVVNIFIVFIQVITIVFIIEKIMKYQTYVPTIQMVVILMCFGLNAIAIGMLITAFSNSTGTASIMTNLITTPTCMLGGCFWPVSIMPKTIQKISKFIPQTWTMDAIKKIQRGSSFWDVKINIFVLLGFATMFLLIAIYKMKKNNKVNTFV